MAKSLYPPKKPTQINLRDVKLVTCTSLVWIGIMFMLLFLI